jgi:hypothetical protein
MAKIVLMALSLIGLIAVSASVAEAACGERGGPGYRGPNGKCVSWEAVGRVCGSPPTNRCTAERAAIDAGDAARDGAANQDRKARAHEAIDRRRASAP